MAKEIKKSFKVYAAWNYEKEEKYINEMGKNGWQLIKGGCFNTLYEKDESKEYIYKIDYNPETMRNSINKERYIGMFEEMGWEHINSTFNGWNYFKKEYNECLDESEYEIYTDKTSYNEMLSKWCKLGWLILIIESIAAILYTFIAISQKSIPIGIEAVIFILLGVWIKRGLDVMKLKMEKEKDFEDIL